MKKTLYGWTSVQTLDQPFCNDYASFGEMQTTQQQETKHLNEQQREPHQPPNIQRIWICGAYLYKVWRKMSNFGNDDNTDTTSEIVLVHQ